MTTTINKHPYIVTVRISGRTHNLITNDEGIYISKPLGNSRTTEQSALKAVKDKCRLCGCKVEEVISIERNI